MARQEGPRREFLDADQVRPGHETEIRWHREASRIETSHCGHCPYSLCPYSTHTAHGRKVCCCRMIVRRTRTLYLGCFVRVRRGQRSLQHTATTGPAALLASRRSGAGPGFLAHPTTLVRRARNAEQLQFVETEVSIPRRRAAACTHLRPLDRVRSVRHPRRFEKIACGRPRTTNSRLKRPSGIDGRGGSL